jgi:hypothetical protein
MHKFQYRSPRYQVNLPVRLDFGDATFSGRCREISQEGMCLELPRALGAHHQGTVSFRYGAASIEIGVRVVRAGTCGGGLEFVFQSDRERGEIAKLLELVAAGTEEAGPHPVR